MRQLLPTWCDEADPYDVYRPADPHGPLLRLNMIATVDGAVRDERGRAGGLGDEGDRKLFRTLRALADGILVGAGTVRVEGYRPHRLRPDLARRREADGRAAPSPVIVVSRSLAFDLNAPLFTEARTPTVVVTCAEAPPERRRAIKRVGRVVVAGERDVDLPQAIAALRGELGLAQLLCEGGPTLNAGLLAGGLVDELCLTIAPKMAGPGQLGLAAGPIPARSLELVSLCEQDDELYARYRLSAG
ncbi:MAG: dihydrofolate reductase family protein [Egibacteraceae bacterium]